MRLGVRGCLTVHRDRGAVTHSGWLADQWLAGTALSAERANRAWRRAKLDHIVRSLETIALSFRTSEQISNWIWYLADQWQEADHRENLATANVLRVCHMWSMVERVWND